MFAVYALGSWLLCNQEAKGWPYFNSGEMIEVGFSDEECNGIFLRFYRWFLQVCVIDFRNKFIAQKKNYHILKNLNLGTETVSTLQDCSKFKILFPF